MREIEKRLDEACDMARLAGEILKSNFGKAFHFETKDDGSLVSDIDIMAQRKIVSEIKARFPEDGVLAEEATLPDSRNSTSGFLWIIDPLDGTHNYIKGIDIFGTSIAVCKGSEVKAGAIYLPMTDCLYRAVQGGGAFCNGEGISVSKRKMCDATMIFDSSLARNTEKSFAALAKLHDKVFNIRMLGSTVAGLSHIANGRAELEVEFSDRVWDFAAGLLLVEEAGGTATDLDGGRCGLDTVGYVVSNGFFHDEILERVKL
ncbi:MAG: inositol monophosphatase [bacterium]